MTETYLVLKCGTKEQFLERLKFSELSFPLVFQHEEDYPLEIVTSYELDFETLRELEKNNIRIKRYTY